MIKCNLRYWMADAKIHRVTDLQKITGLSRNSIIKLRDEEGIDSINIGTLIAVCNAFQRPLSELIEYIPEPKEAPKQK